MCRAWLWRRLTRRRSGQGGRPGWSRSGSGGRWLRVGEVSVVRIRLMGLRVLMTVQQAGGVRRFDYFGSLSFS